jgi:hypothetical protein
VELWTTQVRCSQLHRLPITIRGGHIMRYKVRTSVRATDTFTLPAFLSSLSNSTRYADRRMRTKKMKLIT